MTQILAFLFSISAVWIIILLFRILWAIKNGQFEDMEGPAQRILMDDDDPMIPHNQVRDSAPE
ncbi:MAG: cbb3-type cytochrome oxidase assembly protein CcoS [Betaproteobacteria bacterium]|nr:cbb3-type cytochrome oxidase assembly protein CcoS [Betaproteobacteria bacterium]